MITNFKIFENQTEFNVGDVVVSVRYTNKKYWNREPGQKNRLIPMKTGEKYIVDNIEDNRYLFTLRNYKTKKLIKHPDTNLPKYFYMGHFVPEIELDAKKYNL